MDIGRSQEYNQTTGEATYRVQPDDVALLASKAGVGMNKQSGKEWLQEHLEGIETAIDTYIMMTVGK